VVANSAVAIDAVTTPAQKILDQGRGASGFEPMPAMHADANDKVMMTRDQPMIGPLGIDATGFSVAQQERGKGMAILSEILISGLENNMKFSANDLTNFGPERNDTFDAGGAIYPGRPLSLDNSVMSARNEHIFSKMEEDGSCGFQKSMGWPCL
jgi:hypothetical protein